MQLLQRTRSIALTGVALHALGLPAHAVEYRQLTTLAWGYDAGYSNPEWSPDGTRIAYSSWWVDPGHWYFVFADIGIVQVTDAAAVPFPGQEPRCSPAMDGISSNPSWSPDGDRLVYGCGGGLAIGSVTQSTGAAVIGVSGDDPTWSPDGRRIAYTGNGGLWIVPAAGGAPAQLTAGPDGSPAWSPDGRWIAFVSGRSGDPDIWVVPATGGEPHPVTDGSSADQGPTWSPDGQLIAFGSDRSGNFDIWVVRVANGKLSQLTVDPATDLDPDWSPDGSRIAFISDRSGYANIWIASDLRTVSVTPMSWSQIKQRYR